MTSDDKKIKTNSTPKNDAPPKDKVVKEAAPSPLGGDALPKDKVVKEAAPSPLGGGQKDADISSGYSRGEGQKPVSKAYKDNWNLIFAEKKKR